MWDRLIFFFIFILIAGFGIIKAIDYQDVNPTVIVENRNFANNANTKLFTGDTISEEFIAKNNQLGIISIKFSQNNLADNGYLLFKIKETAKEQWLYINRYKVSQFKQSLYFPFGFPQISDSNNKHYLFEIEYFGENSADSITVLTHISPFLIKYNYSREYLQENKNEIPKFIVKKIILFFYHIELIKYFLIILISLLLNFIVNPSRYKKINVLIKKINAGYLRYYQSFFIKFKNKKLTDILIQTASLSALFIINLLINGPMRLKAFAFNDDVALWHIFDVNRNSSLNFILDTSYNKFRPVFLSTYFIISSLIGNKIWLFGIFNLMFNFFIALILFLIFKKISKNILVAFCLSVTFILSRFAYYDITQSLGLMEAMALLTSIVMFFLLWLYQNTKLKKYFWLSLLTFTSLLLIHERFIVLICLYAFILLFSKPNRKKIYLFGISALPVIIIWGIKIFILKIRPLDGTGGTDILQTFNLPTFFKLFFSGWMYLFEINAGPTYLNGISMDLVPGNIRVLIFIANLCLLTLFTIYFKLILNNKKSIINFLFFFSFIFLTLLAASVTFRLEMRWLYVPFTGLLLVVAHMIGSFSQHRILQNIGPIIVILWISLLIPIETFYRANYNNLYYWDSQSFGNSFYEATLEKYGNNFWNYKTYIFCTEKTSTDMLGCKNHQDFDYFFKQFETISKTTNIELISEESQIQTTQKNKGILMLIYNQNKEWESLN